VETDTPAELVYRSRSSRVMTPIIASSLLLQHDVGGHWSLVSGQCLPIVALNNYNLLELQNES